MSDYTIKLCDLYPSYNYDVMNYNGDPLFIDSDYASILLEFPQIQIDVYENSTGQTKATFNLDMRELFYNRYKNREIGQETESLFFDAIRQTTDFCKMKYFYKLNASINLFKKIGELQTYTETENTTIDDSVTNDTTNELQQNLNPITTQSNRLQSSQKSIVDASVVRDNDIETRRQKYIIETTSQMMDDIEKIKNYFNDILIEYNDCFMTIY